MSRATARTLSETPKPTDSAASLASRVEEVFGKGLSHDIAGLFCIVHMDGPTDAVRESRVRQFRPDIIFDSNCPHCKPFLTEGAYVLYTKDGPFGLRLMPNNTYEMVGLTSNMTGKDMFAGISKTKN